MQKNKLLIFSKAPVAGRVKTRIAKYLGNQKALEIYHRLLEHTLKISVQSEIPSLIYLSEPVKKFSSAYEIQQGETLGDRMLHAFALELTKSNKVCLIGSDCLELTTNDLAEAFHKLNSSDIVLGPANDGGYYLIGMKRAIPELFAGISWGSSTVFAETLKICREQNLSWALLPPHNDIDRVEDIPPEWLSEK